MMEWIWDTKQLHWQRDDGVRVVKIAQEDEWHIYAPPLSRTPRGVIASCPCCERPMLTDVAAMMVANHFVPDLRSN
jgi:hypothetical protein